MLLHQTIIGLEAKEQFKKIGLYPDVIIGLVVGTAVLVTALVFFPVLTLGPLAEGLL